MPEDTHSKIERATCKIASFLDDFLGQGTNFVLLVGAPDGSLMGMYHGSDMHCAGMISTMAPQVMTSIMKSSGFFQGPPPETEANEPELSL